MSYQNTTLPERVAFQPNLSTSPAAADVPEWCHGRTSESRLCPIGKSLPRSAGDKSAAPDQLHQLAGHHRDAIADITQKIMNL